MYILTLFENKRKLKEIETHEPPSPKMIRAELEAIGEDAWFDVSRREFQPEDFDYRDEEEL